MSKRRTRHILQWRSGQYLVTFNKDTGGSCVVDNLSSPKFMFDHTNKSGGDGYPMPLKRLKELWPVERWIVR